MQPTFKSDQFSPAPSAFLAPPPGIAGDLAKFIYDVSEYPIPEVAVTTALGILAGMCGKSFLIGNQSLSIRIVLISERCVAQDAVAVCVERFVRSILPSYPEIKRFIDFTDYRDGKVLRDKLDLQPSFANVVSGMAGKVVGMTTSKNGRMVSLREAIQSPDRTALSGYSAIGQVTREHFHNAFSASVLDSDFVHDFVIVEYLGGQPPKNANWQHPVPTDLHNHIVNFCQSAICNMASHQCLPVKADLEAKQFLDTFDERCDLAINSSKDEVLRRVWNKAHEKVLRVAALLAVADDCQAPIIKLAHAEWAQSFILHCNGTVTTHMDKGPYALQKGAAQHLHGSQHIGTRF